MSEETINRNGIRAQTPDWQEGYEQGLLQIQNKVHELFNEVIEAYESMIAKGESKNVREAMYAVRETPQPTLNWIFADREGHIGRQASGWIPRTQEK